MYNYVATVINVHDGDTVTLDVDLGFAIHFKLKCRLQGINAPELPTPGGIAARDHLTNMINEVEGALVEVITVKDRQEKYGRYLAYLYPPDRLDELSYNARMIADGFAVEYFGGAR